MPRSRRRYFNNAVYHITARGNNKQEVLKKSRDKASFLESLAKFKKRLNFKLYCFVIMDNHVHLVIETQEPTTVSKIMHAILLSYSVKFRANSNYTGYVWQGRFKSNIIDDEKYILSCLEYIHNNPVRAGLCRTAKEYLWSSYAFYHGIATKIGDIIEIDKFNG